MAAGHCALGHAFSLVRGPSTLGTHSWALSSSAFKVYRNKTQKKYDKNNNNRNPHTTTLHPCPWESKLVRSITLSVSVLEALLSPPSAYYQKCLPLSSFHLLKAVRTAKRLAGLCSLCTYHNFHFTFGYPDMPGELPVYVFLFWTDRHQRIPSSEQNTSRPHEELCFAFPN